MIFIIYPINKKPLRYNSKSHHVSCLLTYASPEYKFA